MTPENGPSGVAEALDMAEVNWQDPLPDCMVMHTATCACMSLLLPNFHQGRFWRAAPVWMLLGISWPVKMVGGPSNVLLGAGAHIARIGCCCSTMLLKPAPTTLLPSMGCRTLHATLCRQFAPETVTPRGALDMQSSVVP